MLLGLTLVLALAGSACHARGAANNGKSAAVSGLTMSAPAVPDALMPLTEPVAEQYAYLPLLSSLLEYKPQNRGDKALDGPQDVVSGLATDYKITPKGLVVTLRQAKAASGNVLSPDDVIYTWKRAIAVGDPIALFLMKTGGIDAKNPVTKLTEDTVRLNGKVTPMVLFVVTYYYPGILDSKLVEQNATKQDPWGTSWLRQHSATFGPYSVESFVPGQKVVYAANPNYWGGVPAYKRLTVLAAAESQSPVQLLKAGAVGFASRIDGNAFATMKGDSKFDSYVAPSLSQQVMVLNKKSVPQLRDVNVRRALSLALDRGQMAQTVFKGTATPAQSILGQSLPGMDQATGAYYKYDLAAAKSLLAKTPYAHGFSVDLTIGAGASPGVDPQSVAIAVQDAWAQLGVKVNIENVGSASRFSQIQNSHSFEALLTSEAPAAADIPYAMSLLHVKGGLFNYGSDDDPQVSAAVAKAVRLPLGDSRVQAGLDAVNKWNETVADIPLVDVGIAYVAAKGTCGLATYPYLAALPHRLQPC